MLDQKEIAELKKLTESARRHPLTVRVRRKTELGGIEWEADVRTMDMPEEVARFHAAARDAVPALISENDALRAMLREVEWRGENDGGPACPVCHAYQRRGLVDGVVRGEHADGCRLAALLGEKP